MVTWQKDKERTYVGQNWDNMYIDVDNNRTKL